MQSVVAEGDQAEVLVMFDSLSSRPSFMIYMLHFVQVVTQTLTNAASNKEGSYYYTFRACHSPTRCTRFHHPIKEIDFSNIL